jgi:uncharacterized protein involved in type VI secretion and phage assembly
LQTFLSCSIRLGEDVHKGFVLEVSSNSAFISSRCVPQVGSPVSISLQLPDSSSTLTLNGHVTRSNRGISDHGEIGRFALQLNRISPDSMLLIKKLSELVEKRKPAAARH